MKTLKIKLLKVWPRPLHLMDYGLRKGSWNKKKAFVAKIHIQKAKLKEGNIFIQR